MRSKAKFMPDINVIVNKMIFHDVTEKKQDADLMKG